MIVLVVNRLVVTRGLFEGERVGRPFPLLNRNATLL